MVNVQIWIDAKVLGQLDEILSKGLHPELGCVCSEDRCIQRALTEFVAKYLPKSEEQTQDDKRLARARAVMLDQKLYEDLQDCIAGMDELDPEEISKMNVGDFLQNIEQHLLDIVSYEILEESPSQTKQPLDEQSLNKQLLEDPAPSLAVVTVSQTPLLKIKEDAVYKTNKHAYLDDTPKKPRKVWIQNALFKTTSADEESNLPILECDALPPEAFLFQDCIFEAEFPTLKYLSSRVAPNNRLEIFYTQRNP